MPNPNMFFSEAGNFTIEAAIRGQTPLTFYDPLEQMAYRPDLRGNIGGEAAVILPYQDSGFWGLWSQVQSLLGGDKRMVKDREFYWAEYDLFETQAFTVNSHAAGAPGATVTATINAFSLSQNGLFAKPLEGFQAYFKHNQQKVNIGTVTEVGAGNITVQFIPINNEVIDLSAKSTYIVVQTPMQVYPLNSPSAEIPTHGEVKNPPILYKSFVQKYEDGLAVEESEIDGWIYNKTFFISKGLDSMGQPVEYFYIPTLSRDAEAKIIASRNMHTLFNQRDNVAQEGFDGMLPTIRKYGMFNFSYDNFLSGSFKSLLFTMIKNLRRVNGSNEYMIAHSFNFQQDWGEAMAQLIQNFNQNYKYSLFGDGGTGNRDFTYFQFGDWKYGDYNFRKYLVDMFDSYRYGHILEDFAMLLPLKRFSDTQGNQVPIVNFVAVEGAEPGKDQKVWIDDARVRGQRNLRVFIKDNFGIEVHAPTRLGLITKSVAS
jgi:hypothetical protein